MLRALRIETVRGRLTAFYVAVLAVALVGVGGLIYVLLARAMYARIDENLHALMLITITSLGNDLAEGQDVEDAARSTATELSSRRQMLAIHDENGRLLAAAGEDDPLDFTLPALDAIPGDEELLVTAAEIKDTDDRHRLALRRVSIAAHGVTYIVMIGSSLEPTDEELESLREILAYVGPIALALAGVGGWFIARQSLRPVSAMATRAGEITAANLNGRLPVVNPDDELGRLAEAFNQLLSRLEASLTQQRQFMADASHELRTPVTTVRTAAHVALQQAHRQEDEYRHALSVIEQQTVRLSRVVEDMFTLARADAGTYPVRREAMYLDEVLDEIVRAARVIAETKGVRIELSACHSAAFTGDEELIRRIVSNLLGNALRHAPKGSPIAVSLRPARSGYSIEVADQGPGIPAEMQPHIFDRFFRGDTARSRTGTSDDGAGLGLALARWIARAHGGDVTLTRSSATGTVFTVSLPEPGVGG